MDGVAGGWTGAPPRVLHRNTAPYETEYIKIWPVWAENSMTYNHSKNYKHNGCNDAAHDHSDAGRLSVVMVAVVTEADFKIVMNGDIDRPSLVQEERPVVLTKE